MKFLGMTIDFWVILGIGGQLLFAARLLVQWIYSEMKKESLIPVAYWYLSIVGGIILLVYAIHRRDPVFILGQLTGSFIYIRNLVLIYRKKAIEKTS